MNFITLQRAFVGVPYYIRCYFDLLFSIRTLFHCCTVICSPVVVVIVVIVIAICSSDVACAARTGGGPGRRCGRTAVFRLARSALMPPSVFCRGGVFFSVGGASVPVVWRTWLTPAFHARHLGLRAGLLCLPSAYALPPFPFLLVDSFSRHSRRVA